MPATRLESPVATRITSLIEAIAAGEGDRFCRHDAEALCRLLSGLPICRAIGFELTAKPAPDTAHEPSPANDRSTNAEGFAWEMGIADRQFGPYVVTRTGETSFVFRHAEDRHAFVHDHQEMLLARNTGRWTASLNRPRPYNFGLFKVFIGRQFEPWKRGM